MGSLNGSGPEKIVLSWDENVALAVELADGLRPYRPMIDPKKDRLLIPLLGGALVGLVAGRAMGFTAKESKGVGIGSYATGSTEAGRLETDDLPSPEWLDGMRVTILEDCCDGGDTLKVLTDYCLANGAVDVVSGVIYFKPDSCRPDFRPTVHVRETEAWIEFPDAPFELIGQRYRLGAQTESGIHTAVAA
ncbi:MAG TPA: hypothetical protein VLF40_00655 [Candidatus Saccharimonadales bacterium]|nr:hypothetical protein [Candidatus Saccharimonadales bacterium]